LFSEDLPFDFPQQTPAKQREFSDSNYEGKTATKDTAKQKTTTVAAQQKLNEIFARSIFRSRSSSAAQLPWNHVVNKLIWLSCFLFRKEAAENGSGNAKCQRINQAAIFNPKIDRDPVKIYG